MRQTQPALFVSHGAPTIVIDGSPAHAFLKSWTAQHPARPEAIIVATAHFEASEPTLTAHPSPGTMHDFGGFPDSLFRMRYPAPGHPELAARAATLLRTQGFSPRLDVTRGLDHGTWTPLTLMYPDADIPVVQLSIDPARDPAWHYGLGAALAPLRADNVLIMGSGALTHDLRGFFHNPLPVSAPPAPHAAAFADWAAAAIAERRTESLLDWERTAPHAHRNHPSAEHLMPFFVAMGAGGQRGVRAHASFSHGVLAMDAYVFSEESRTGRCGSITTLPMTARDARSAKASLTCSRGSVA